MDVRVLCACALADLTAMLHADNLHCCVPFALTVCSPCITSPHQHTHHQQGRYVIKVPGLGVSHAFTVSRDALRPALGAVARTFYGQRCGVALEQEYIAPWSRPEACHTDDAQVMEINPPPTWFQNK